MGPEPRPTPPRALLCCATVAGLLACLALAGCKASDPLETARRQQETGDIAGSLQTLREVLAENRDDPEVNFLYGQALARSGRQNLAMWPLRKAMQDPRWLVPAGLQLAYTALANYDFNETDEITGRILEQEPENVMALLLRANAHAHWRKDPEQALRYADRVLELDPDRLEAYEPRILALLALGRKEEAGEALAEVGRRLSEVGAPPDRLAWHCSTTAVFQDESGEREQARETWQRCLEDYPASLEVVSGATRFHDVLGEWDRSLAIVRAALESAPKSRAFRRMLAERLRAMGEPAEAEAVLREGTQSEDPHTAAAAWLDLGRLRQEMGEYGAAAEALGRAFEISQAEGFPDAKLAFDYADTLVMAGQLERALEVAEGLSVPAHQHLIRAGVAQQRGDPARALEEFDAANELWPDNPWARYETAMVAEELGDFERAVAELRYAIRDDPGATDARTRLAQLWLAEGKPGRAEGVLRPLGGAPLEIEGQILTLYLAGWRDDLVTVRASLEQLDRSRPAWVGRGLAQAAEGVALRGGPTAALGMLASAPMADYTHPRYAAALRALVKFAHEEGQTAEAKAVLQKALRAHPESSALQEIVGFDLERSGAAPDAVRAAYQRALELDSGNAEALAGLARLARADDPAAAVAFFDRAAAADPSDPSPQLEAAEILAAQGETLEAEERLDTLLREHPYEGEAAAARVRLDLEQGKVTPHTLERARRAVRFRGGVEALELLSRVHEALGEPELAAKAAERARTLRDLRESGASAGASES